MAHYDGGGCFFCHVAVGLRHGLGLHLYNDILSLDVNHPLLRVTGSAQHDVIRWLGEDPVQIDNPAVMALRTPSHLAVSRDEPNRRECSDPAPLSAPVLPTRARHLRGGWL